MLEQFYSSNQQTLLRPCLKLMIIKAHFNWFFLGMTNWNSTAFELKKVNEKFTCLTDSFRLTSKIKIGIKKKCNKSLGRLMINFPNFFLIKLLGETWEFSLEIKFSGYLLTLENRLRWKYKGNTRWLITACVCDIV